MRFTECFHTRPDHFAPFLRRVFSLVFQQHFTLSYAEKTSFVLFLINCFQTLDDRVVRESCMRCVYE